MHSVDASVTGDKPSNILQGLVCILGQFFTGIMNIILSLYKKHNPLHSTVRLFIFILLILTGIPGSAQKNFSRIRNVIIEPRFQYGVTLPLYDAVSYLIEENVHAIECNIAFPTYGTDYWEKIYRYPRTGVGYSFNTLGNNRVLGYAHALYGYMDVPLNRIPRKFSVNYQIAFGLAYITRHFDPHDNHLNRAISSHGNVYIRFGLNGKYRLNARSELVLEAGGTHFSNGKFRSPNYGINTATFSIGANYLLGDAGRSYENPEIPDFNKKFRHTLIIAGGSKVFDNLLGNKYFISSLSYTAERNTSLKRRFGLGADLFYDKSISEALANEEGIPDNTFFHLLRLGMHISHTVQYKKVSFSMQLGHYLYSKYTDLTLIYSRIAIQYMLSDHLMGNVSVKSHLAKADFVEWGIGYFW